MEKLLKRTNEKNICKQGKKYSVRKTIHNKLIFFAAFDTIEDAIAYRDYCVTHDWDLKCRRKKLEHLMYISPMEMLEGVKVV